MNKDILICGIGGQGTVLVSKIIAAASAETGYSVHSAETIGMAQRGGSVTSHVRIGGSVFSPLIPCGNADMLLAFEPAEAVRNLRYLKKDGVAVVNTVATKPVTESLRASGYEGGEMVAYLREKCRCIFVNAEEACKPFGSIKYFNILLLGIACGTGLLGLSRETILAQMNRIIPEKFRAVNTEAFHAGYDLGAKEKGENL